MNMTTSTKPGGSDHTIRCVGEQKCGVGAPTYASMVGTFPSPLGEVIILLDESFHVKTQFSLLENSSS